MICEPGYSLWLSNISERMRSKGNEVEICDTLKSWTAVKDFLQVKKKNGKMFDTLSLIPGHGCYPQRNVMEISENNEPMEEIYQSDPGMVWSQCPSARPIRGESLRRLINLCFKVCNHLHLGTCYQGCSLNLYEDMLSRTKEERSVTISGWTHGVLVLRDDIFDRFHIEGCHSVSFRKTKMPRLLAYRVINLQRK